MTTMRRRSITSTVPALFERATSAPQPKGIVTPMAARFISEVLSGTVPARVYQYAGNASWQKLAAIDNLPGHDGGHGSTAETASVERSVARFAGRVGGAERPSDVGRKNRQAGRLVGGHFSFDAEDTRRPGGKQFD